MKELITIQSELKAPKGQFNKYGGYKYRSCEDILQALTPLLAKTNCHLTLDDEIVDVSGRIYVKAIATIKNSTGETETTHAFAREEETKKGMDASQITGSASSYARKYALNGLFCIDDTKDADATNTHGKDEAPAQQPYTDTDEFLDIQNAIMCCNTTMELTNLYKEHPQWQTHKEIMAVFTRRKNELNNGNQTQTK